MNSTGRKLTAFALVLMLLLTVGLVACHRSAEPEESTAAVSTQNADLVDNLKEKQSKAVSKASSAVSRAVPTTKARTTTAAKKQTTAASTSKKASTTATTLTSGLFQVSEDYKKKFNYCVAVNTAQNVVTIYKKGLDGNYSIPVKAMVCSCGRAGHETPQGQYSTLAKQRWLYLIDGSYGQYCTKFKEHYWFHSVPYYTQDPSNLEFMEYNKLGQNASAGCVRMSVRDVKWVYDHIPLGTVVRVYSSTDKEPLIRPTPLTIDTSDSNKNRGWDPTDPDSANPYHK